MPSIYGHYPVRRVRGVTSSSMSRATVAAVAELEAPPLHPPRRRTYAISWTTGWAEDVVTQAAKEVGIEVASRRLREVAAECIDQPDAPSDDVEPNDDLEPPLTSGPTSDRARPESRTSNFQ